MLKLRFTIIYQDGQKAEVTSRYATEIAFERRFGKPLLSLFASDLSPNASEAERLTAARQMIGQIHSDYIAFLAWHSSRSLDQYDAWIEKIEDIEWNFVESVDPTNPVPSDGDSAF